MCQPPSVAAAPTSRATSPANASNQTSLRPRRRPWLLARPSTTRSCALWPRARMQPRDLHYEVPRSADRATQCERRGHAATADRASDGRCGTSPSVRAPTRTLACVPCGAHRTRGTLPSRSVGGAQKSAQRGCVRNIMPRPSAARRASPRLAAPRGAARRRPGRSGASPPPPPVPRPRRRRHPPPGGGGRAPHQLSP